MTGPRPQTPEPQTTHAAEEAPAGGPPTVTGPRPTTPEPPAPAAAAKTPARGIPEVLKVWLPVLLLAGAGFAVAWQFVEPAPPSVVRIASGPPGGAYERIVERAAASLARRGVRVRVRPTSGSVENAALLRAGEVDAALLQGGGFPELGPDERLQAVVSVGFEPVLILLGGTENAGGGVRSLDLPEASGLLGDARVAVGGPGSGTAPLARRILGDLLGPDAAGERIEAGGDEALELLRSGGADAAFLVAAPEAPRVAEALADPALAVASLPQAGALARRDAVLTPVTLLRGVVDPAGDLPPADVRTVAAATFYAVRDDTHRAVVQLLVQAAREDPTADLLADAGAFPTLLHAALPVAKEARWFFERGPSVLYRHLPFPVASFVDRLTILLLPLLTLLIPLVRVAPPMLRWRVRRRIYRWYRRLRLIEADADAGAEPGALRARLAELDREAAGTEVPLSYMEEFYNLRLHIDLLRRRLGGPPADAEPGGGPATA